MKTVHSGMWLFAERNTTRQFGFASASSSLREPGVVTMHLAVRGPQMSIYRVPHGITVEFPEEWAGELSERLYDAVVRVRHLRELSRGERLSAEAIYESATLTSPPDDGELIEGLTNEDVHFFSLPGAPPPTSEASLTLDIHGLQMTYRSTGRSATISVDTVMGLRLSKPSEPRWQSQNAEAWVCAWNSSPWMNALLCSRDVAIRHYVFQFPEQCVEVLGAEQRSTLRDGSSSTG
jgi:hypothetical protein